jgi:septal ring factor EnvC (AmiA/AmiB activator)
MQDDYIPIKQEMSIEEKLRHKNQLLTKTSQRFGKLNEDYKVLEQKYNTMLQTDNEYKNTNKRMRDEIEDLEIELRNVKWQLKISEAKQSGMEIVLKYISSAGLTNVTNEK